MSAHIGVLMLDTAFPRIPGDVGNSASYDMPVRFHTVSGADVMDVVKAGAPSDTLVAQFIEGAKILEAGGAVGIVTSCGFLGHAQQALAQAVQIPVVASALSLGPLIRSMTGGRRIGIITADSRALTSDLLATAGLSADDVAIAGMESAPAWQCLILAPKHAQARHLDPNEIGQAVEEAALCLISTHPDIGSLLFECTNLPPYAERLHASTSLTVFHILHAARLMWDSYTISPHSVG